MPAPVASCFLCTKIQLGQVQIFQWLIDTKERLLQYLAIAKDYAISLHVNIEIDVGLHGVGCSLKRNLLKC